VEAFFVDAAIAELVYVGREKGKGHARESMKELFLETDEGVFFGYLE
jgi:hypothetical protein